MATTMMAEGRVPILAEEIPALSFLYPSEWERNYVCTACLSERLLLVSSL